MNLRSSHLANMGARLGRIATDHPACVAAGPARESSSQAPDTHVDSRATPDAALGNVPASGEVSPASRAEGAPAGRGISRDGRPCDCAPSATRQTLRASPDTDCPARVPAGPAREQNSQAPDRGSRVASDGGATSSDAFVLTLTDNVQAVLVLAAKAAGVAPGEFVARAICAYAEEAVGFPAMCDELHVAPEPARVGHSRFRTAADAGHGGIPP